MLSDESDFSPDESDYEPISNENSASIDSDPPKNLMKQKSTGHNEKHEGKKVHFKEEEKIKPSTSSEKFDLAAVTSPKNC